VIRARLYERTVAPTTLWRDYIASAGRVELTQIILTLRKAFPNPNDQVQATKTLRAGAAPETIGGYVIPRRRVDGRLAVPGGQAEQRGRTRRTRRTPPEVGACRRRAAALRVLPHRQRSQGDYLRCVPPEVPVVESEELLEAGAEPRVECSIEVAGKRLVLGNGRSVRARPPTSSANGTTRSR